MVIQYNYHQRTEIPAHPSPTKGGPARQKTDLADYRRACPTTGRLPSRLKKNIELLAKKQITIFCNSLKVNIFQKKESTV